MGDIYLVVSDTQAIFCAVLCVATVIGLFVAAALIERARKPDRGGTQVMSTQMASGCEPPSASMNPDVGTEKAANG